MDISRYRTKQLPDLEFHNYDDLFNDVELVNNGHSLQLDKKHKKHQISISGQCYKCCTHFLTPKPFLGIPIATFLLMLHLSDIIRANCKLRQDTNLLQAEVWMVDTISSSSTSTGAITRQ